MSEKNDNKVPNVPNLRFGSSEVWTQTTIGKIAQVVGGGTPETDNLDYWNGNIQWFTPSEVGQTKYIEKSERTISVDGLNKSSAKLLPVGTLLLSTRATVGECSIALNECSTNQGFQSLIASDKVNNEFLYYLIATKKRHFVKYACGSTFLEISNKEVAKTKIFVPQQRVQEKIATFLSKIDQRIETQSKIIEDIETLRKWIINQQFASDANCAIGAFIEQTSERNKINSVDRVLSVSNKYGFINQSEQFEDREVASDDRTNYKIVRRNDFAFNPARINVGSIAKLDTYDIGIVSPMYICFKSNNKNLDADYLSNFFLSNSFKNALNKRLEGSVRQCLQFDALCDIKLFVPSLDVQISFVSKIKAITKKLTIEKDILTAYKKQKAYLLSNMFI